MPGSCWRTSWPYGAKSNRPTTRRLREPSAYRPGALQLAGAASFAILALVILGGLWLRAWTRAPAAFGGGVSRQITSDPGCKTEPVISPDGGLIAFTSVEKDRSDIWITDVKGGSRLRLTDVPAMNHSPTWLPDGSALAFVSDRGGESSIWKVPRLGGTASLLLEKGEFPTVSPDGRRLAFSRANPAGNLRIAIAPLDDPAHVVWLTGDDDGERDHVEPSWSPDGGSICYSDTRNLWLVPLDKGRPHRLTSENGVDREPVWSSDGRFVLFWSERGGTRALWRVAAESGAAQRLTPGTGPESHPSVSSDGSKLVYSTYTEDYDIVLRDLASGGKGLIQSLLYDAAPTFGPDATTVVFTSTRRAGQYDLWTQRLSEGKPTGPPTPLTDFSGGANTPAYSPDGRWVAFKREVGPGRREIWVVAASGGVPGRFSDGLGSDIQPAWSADGTQLAYVAERAGESHIWAAGIENGRRKGAGRQITWGQGTDRLPAWSPDGRKIAFVRATQAAGEIWTVPSAGGLPSGPIAKAIVFGRLRFEKRTGWLWFSSVVGEGATQLRKVPADGGVPVAALKADLFAEASPPGDFDLSPDSRFLAFTRQETRGNVWLLENKRGTY